MLCYGGMACWHFGFVDANKFSTRELLMVLLLLLHPF
jgi:hypothetical protein